MAARKKNGVANWLKLIYIIGPAFAAVVGVISVMWTLFSLVSSVQSQSTRNAEYERRLGTLENKLSEQSSTATGIKRDLNEIETQFCATDIVRNLMHAHDLRMVAMLWEKTYGTKYPVANAYYPKICNHNPAQ